METTLHRQLKQLYAGEEGESEVRLGRYRIDAVRDDLLIEVQHGGLSAIRDKIGVLVKKHNVLVVKPIVARKRITRRSKPGGDVASRRWSPKRGTLLDLFHELVHFTRVFPHKRLTIEAPLVEIEEHRVPGHGRRRRWRRNDHVVEDQTLIRVVESASFRTPADLLKLLPKRLPSPFDTADLAKGLEIERWIAQRIAYALRKTGAITEVGKRGNALLYKKATKRKKRAA
ncbi:MAG: hypothetical protein AAGJ46_20640 [Planctomycetota bacterium]